MGTALSSLTVRVTIDMVVADGHGMVTRCVSEEAAERRLNVLATDVEEYRFIGRGDYAVGA